MATLDLYSSNGEKIGNIDYSDSVFSGPVRKTLIWESVKMFLANQRAGTVGSKTRSEVKGSTRKIYRQKGSGNARHGDIKAPIFVGGGQNFGPKTRDYSYRIPAKARKQALRSVLVQKIKEGKIKILSDFIMEKPKTKLAKLNFDNLNVNKALLLIEERSDILERSIRNLINYKVAQVDSLNVYDVLRYDNLLITKKAFEKLEGKLS